MTFVLGFYDYSYFVVRIARILLDNYYYYDYFRFLLGNVISYRPYLFELPQVQSFSIFCSGYIYFYNLLI